MAALAVSVLITTAAFAQTPGAAATQTPGLKIVVLKGEDAVNIIQQKTAVAPLVEVRDRNNLPVPGAVVTFTVGGGQGATFGGATTLTVTTNAAGQAAAAGFTPTAAGAIQVNATAVFQGQTAIATITQTNVMTAAEAAGAAGGSSAGGSGASGGGTSGAAGGAGGAAGMSATTIGIIGGAIAGGAVAVGAAAGGGGDGGSTATTSTPTTATPTGSSPPTTTPAPTTPPPTTPAPTTPTGSGVYSGPITGSYTSNWSSSVTGGPTESCTYNYNQTGTMRITLTVSSASTATATADWNGNIVQANFTCSGGPVPSYGDLNGPIAITYNLTGSPSNFSYVQDLSQPTAPVPAGTTVTSRGTLTVTGSLSNGVVTGSVAFNQQISVTTTVGGITATSSGTAQATFPFTARQ